MHQFQKKKIFDLKAERQKAKLPYIWATFQMPSTAEAGLGKGLEFHLDLTCVWPGPKHWSHNQHAP